MAVVDVVKVQQRGKGTFMVTVPIEIASAFNIKKGDKVQVSMDSDGNSFTYKLITETK